MVKDLMKGIKQEIRDVSRVVKDFGNPPSTLEQVTRAVKDLWRDEVEPVMGKVDGTVKKGLEGFKKSFEEFQANPNKTLEEGASFFKDMAKQCKEAVSNSPILKKFGTFLETVGNLIGSIIKGEKIEESWKQFKDSAVALSSAIKEAVIGKGKQSIGM